MLNNASNSCTMKNATLMATAVETPSTSVDRTIAILEAVATRSSGMSNAEISRKLHIPKSSASYILRALEKHGYLRREHESGKYRLEIGRASCRERGKR